MSCFIYGYLEYSDNKEHDSIIRLIETIGLGLTIDSGIQLYNFPSVHRPIDDRNHVLFALGGRPGTNDSTMLLWEEDLDPNHTCGKIPYKFKDRLDLLMKVFHLLIEYFNATKITVAITDSSQIEKVTICRFSTLNKNILADCEISCPPDVLYVASRDLVLV